MKNGPYFMDFTEKQKEMIRYYESKYYSNNDEGHGMEHIEDVWEVAMHLINTNHVYSVSIKTDLLLIAVLLHDIFTEDDRENHHILAANYVLSSKNIFLIDLTDNEREIVANAIFEHRASLDIPTSSVYSEVLKYADNGIPDFDKTVDRIVKSNLKKYKESYHKDVIADEIVDKVIKHLNEKFSSYGYIWRDKKYLALFRDQAEKMWDRIESVTSDEIKLIIEKHL